MFNFNISLEDCPSEEDISILIHNLVQFNDSRAEKENWQALAVFVRDVHRQIVGGLNGHTHWGWLTIRHLWLDESLRELGYGSKLMSYAENEALRRGCLHSWVDTFDFQALSFYQKLGYEVFGILEDFPPGHKRYFLNKKLLTHLQI